MSHWLLEPFQFEFFRRALLAAVLVGGLCGLVSPYVVLRRMSYIGHGLSHAVFGGAVVGYVLRLNFYLGAGAWGFLSALLIGLIARRRKIGADAAIGLVTTASFALGVALISRTRQFTRNFEAALFGHILGVTETDLWIILGASLLALALLLFHYKPLLFALFDPEVAEVYGIPTARMELMLSMLLAAVVIAAMQVLGVTLIAAGLVVPAATARLLTDDFDRLVLLSILLGSLSGLIGLYLSYHLDIASGAAIVLVATGMFAGALGWEALARQRPLRLPVGF
ncbi:metal ABC transporter permease [Thermoflexus sp.]|uniref:metal ABC transporter permease n=1 Tax=Thermoflexus sp. TaxID=1969742 RepID=UPI0035E40D3F